MPNLVHILFKVSTFVLCLCLSLCICSMHLQCLWNLEEGVGLLRTGVAGYGFWDLNLRYLETTERVLNFWAPFLVLHTYSSIICITLYLGQKSWEKLEGAMMLESQCLVSVVDKSFFLFTVVWLWPVLWKRKPSRMTLEGWGNTKGDDLDNVTATVSGEM